ncbi:MAG: CDP-glycerol glycerophosphotransferase family protein [Actinomycetales bacterium]
MKVASLRRHAARGVRLARRLRPDQRRAEAGAQTQSVIGRAAAIRQTERSLEVDLLFREDLTARRLVGRVDDTWVDLGVLRSNGRPGGYHGSVDLAAFVQLPTEPAILDLYVDVDLPREDVRRLEAELELALLVTPDTRPTASGGTYRLRLGRFRQTDFAEVMTSVAAGRSVTVFPDATGHIQVALDCEPAPYAEMYVNRLSAADGRLRMKGRVETRHGDVEDAWLVLKGRASGIRYSHPVALTLDEAATRRSFGLRSYPFEVNLPWTDLLKEPDVQDDLVDAWLSVQTRQSGGPFEIRVGRTRFWARYLTRDGMGEVDGKAAILTPYYTFKAKRTSFQLDLFEPGNLRFMRASVRKRHLSRWAYRGRPIWLVGEKPDKAQDTGLAFFRYLRAHHPEIDAYYVIDPDSPELPNVAPLGNVLMRRSKEHIRATLLAERVFGSHHPDFLYPVRTPRFKRAVRATRVFLQHGVMGTKWMVPNYGKASGDFETDLFIVSSEREKQYIVGDFGYDPKEVVVTGLSRFDSLLEPDTTTRRQLLILPTWRDWIPNEAAYLESEYHERWSGLLHDPRLQAFAEQHGFDIVFCLHPNMQRFTSLFQDAPVRVLSHGEIDVQHLMKESAVLLTDYSSVGFDFSFLHRPVLYYQFDQERFLGPRGSHLDLDAELPGPIVFTDDDLLAELSSLADNDFRMDTTYRRRADRFMTHRDRRNNERIFSAAATARTRNTWLHRVTSGEVPTSAVRLFRRSPAYFPVMRRMFSLLTRLPADDDLVVFESGVGSQYADSPRYIYEELIRRGTPMRKVWAYSGKIHHGDSDTKVVQRLSPSYYWYLGRARYWVNNQNLPHYFVRRPDGIYLQTWHGTPLKRMLHDLDTIVGRDEGYITRVSNAAQQWNLLASPSPWATDRMRSAFRYTGPVVELGYPRNDIFFRPDRDEVAASVRRRLGIAPDKTVVLYAPTFRDDQAAGANRFTQRLALDLDTLRATLGDDVVFLIRYHGLVRTTDPVPEEHALHVRDVSKYPEIQELYLVSDALVTDYSSVFFDFACLRRPIIFYAYDLDSYRDELRGFYLDYELEMPGPVVTTEKELYAALNSLPDVEAEYAGRYDEFLARFSPHDDGGAAARVVDEMLVRGAAVHASRRRGKR